MLYPNLKKYVLSPTDFKRPKLLINGFTALFFKDSINLQDTISWNLDINGFRTHNREKNKPYRIPTRLNDYITKINYPMIVSLDKQYWEIQIK